MSVHNHAAADPSAAPTEFAPTHGGAASSTPEFPRHVVTAVLVSHDGARWLPDALAGLFGQERPVQYAVGADTGSADASARLLTEALGQERVLHLARRSGFGTAVDEAVRSAPVLTPDHLPYLKRPSSWDPVTRTWRDEAYEMPELPHGEPVQWLWLLHDDCAPEPTALTELLRVADASPRAAIVGPKVRSWYDKRQLLEVGVSIARSGRRWTGLERREQDQGQHDQVRPVLAVSSAGMLIRRDVWEELGGFDARLPLMRDDVDLCWRAQALGHQVLVAPDAVLRHAEAAARERRPIDCVGRAGRTATDGDQGQAARPRTSRASSPHRVDKAGAVYTLLANTRGALLPYVALRVVLGTLLRTLGYLVGKAPGQAVDEFTGLFSVVLRPGRVLAARRRRGRPAVAASELRPLFPPPGATVRATVEQIASNLGGRSEPESSAGGRHGAVESGPGGDDADFLDVEQFTRLKRIARKPAPVLFAALLLISLIACRDLIGGGSLAGGALLPAPGDVGDLWARYADTWQPVGVGSADAGPPYLAVLAALATLLLGSTGFTLTLLLVCSVPLAGLTAYFASRPLIGSRLLRAWASVAYAFLPATTGALASGRLGTAVLAVLLPLMARAAVAASGLTPGRGGGRQVPGWRAVWAYALLLSFTMAFTPVVWPIAAALGLGALALRGTRGGLLAYGVRLLAVLLTPLLVLAPWSLSLLTHPGRLLEEAGLDYATGAASALELLTLTPGGPGAPGAFLMVGVLLAALAALLRSERQLAVRAAWAAALVGFLFAALAGGDRWAGPATLVYGLALLCAGLVGAEGARARVAEQSFGWRQPVAALIALAAGLAPLIAACTWMLGGADGPIERRDPVQVPAFVAEEARTRDQARTLVLDGSAARVDYILVRGSGARLGDAEAVAAAGGDERLDSVVANLVAGSGADQTSQLGGYAVRYVLVRDSAPRQFARVLDTTPGLTRLSQQDGSALWRVDQRVARVSIVRPAGADAGGSGDAGTAPVPVAAGPVAARDTLPAGPEGRVLRVADKAAPGWRATLDGKELPRTTVDGWAQGFKLPATGGRLQLSYQTPVSHTLWVWTQGLFALVLLVLALPGRRREIDDDLPAADAPAPQASGAGPAAGAPGAGGEVPAQPAGEGRRARRLRAASETAGATRAGGPPDAAAGPGGGPDGAQSPAPSGQGGAQSPAPFGQDGAQSSADWGPGGAPPHPDWGPHGAPEAPPGPPVPPLPPEVPGTPPPAAPVGGPPPAAPLPDPLADPYAVPQQGYGQQWPDPAGGHAPTPPGYPPYQEPYQDPYAPAPGGGYPGQAHPGGQPADGPAGYQVGGYPADQTGQAAPYPDAYQGGYDPYGYGQPYPGAPGGAPEGTDDTTYGDGTIPGPRRDGSQA